MSKLSSKPYTLYDPSKALPSAYVKRAAKELGEKSEQIPAHIESFRRWLKSMPHLKCNASKLIKIFKWSCSHKVLLIINAN